MDKSALHAYLDKIVVKVLAANGLDDSKENCVVGRSLMFAALTRYEKDLVASVTPPAAKK